MVPAAIYSFHRRANASFGNQQAKSLFTVNEAADAMALVAVSPSQAFAVSMSKSWEPPAWAGNREASPASIQGIAIILRSWGACPSTVMGCPKLGGVFSHSGKGFTAWAHKAPFFL